MPDMLPFTKPPSNTLNCATIAFGKTTAGVPVVHKKQTVKDLTSATAIYNQLCLLHSNPTPCAPKVFFVSIYNFKGKYVVETVCTMQPGADYKHADHPAEYNAQVYALLSTALETLHSHGLIHGDIQPGNVMTETDPSTGELLSASFIDFGSPIDLAPTAWLTREQLALQPGFEASDSYSDWFNLWAVCGQPVSAMPVRGRSQPMSSRLLKIKKEQDKAKEEINEESFAAFSEEE